MQIGYLRSGEHPRALERKSKHIVAEYSEVEKDVRFEMRFTGLY